MAKSTPLKSKSKSADAGNIKIDKDWEQRMLKARRMLHPSPGAAPTFYDDAGHLYKICPCCGNPFYPTHGHDRDQIYCKHPECKRLRTNLRAKIYYLKQMLQGALTRIAYCLRKKMERERRKQRMGIEPVVTPVHRRRNSMRRMKADMEKKLDDLKTCFNGMLVSLGYKTESDVNVAMNNFRSKGYSVLFDTAANIINRLVASQKSGCLVATLKAYRKPEILCLDEIGYLPIGKLEADLFFQVISARYETGSIILTSNIAFKDWVQIFDNNAALTSAILDRVIHHCDIITIEGPSYRLHGKQ